MADSGPASVGSSTLGTLAQEVTGCHRNDQACHRGFQSTPAGHAGNNDREEPAATHDGQTKMGSFLAAPHGMDVVVRVVQSLGKIMDSRVLRQQWDCSIDSQQEEDCAIKRGPPNRVVGISSPLRCNSEISIWSHRGTDITHCTLWYGTSRMCDKTVSKLERSGH